jgi:branched-chain amino acid transport system permease protein
MGFLDIFVVTIFPSTMRNLISFSIILVILSFRPHGFFGRPHSAQLRL